MMKKPWRKVIKIAVIWILITLLLTGTGPFLLKASAHNKPVSGPTLTPIPPGERNIDVINPHLQVEHRTLTDGTPISKYLINGPSKRPSGSESQVKLPSSLSATAEVLLNFPSYSWVFGCSAVSASMIAAYQDRGAYPNIYTGPTNGGVMPLSDTTWSTWRDNYNDEYPNNPLIASHLGVDGWTTRGSIDDYWVRYNSTSSDPYITGDWAQHTWGAAVGDYMKTSQSAYGNVDGATGFWASTDSKKLTCAIMEDEHIHMDDGTYGRKLFYEARGYTVTDCYTQNTDNQYVGGFSLANFQAEINAGYPVLLNLAGHSVVGYGYEGSEIYIRDTWDNDPNNTYTMPWGGSYDGMQLLQVSVVHLEPVPIPYSNKAFLPLVNKSSTPNESPLNISLSKTSILENQPINTVVGYLSTTDPNPGDTFTYRLVSGDGSADNAYFNISGNQLRSSQVFDYEVNHNYSIRVRSTDQGGLYYEKVFQITISDLSDGALINGDFELGHVGWVEYSSNNFEIISQDIPDFPAYSGDWFAWLGGYDDEYSSI